LTGNKHELPFTRLHTLGILKHTITYCTCFERI